MLHRNDTGSAHLLPVLGLLVETGETFETPDELGRLRQFTAVDEHGDPIPDPIPDPVPEPEPEADDTETGEEPAPAQARGRKTKTTTPDIATVED